MADTSMTGNQYETIVVAQAGTGERAVLAIGEQAEAQLGIAQ